MGAFDNFLSVASNWIQLHPSIFLFLIIFMAGCGIAVSIHEADPLFNFQLKWSEWKYKREKRRQKKVSERRDKKTSEIQNSASNSSKAPVIQKSFSNEQSENKSMSDLWSDDSLRGMYWQSKQRLKSKDIPVAVRSDVGFFNKIALKLEAKTEMLEEHDRKVQGFIKILKAPICPHCLKTIIMEEISFSCPFCDQEHFKDGTSFHSESGKFIDTVAAVMATSMAKKMLVDSIFGECMKCKAKIQYLACPHCQQGVDLFAPYNYQELERKRYGR